MTCKQQTLVNVKIPIYEVETDIIDSEDDTDEENLDESMEE